MTNSDEDTWLQFLPTLHRRLADPAAAPDLPRSPRGMSHEVCCAYWESLRYLLRSLLGSRDLGLGLAWWYAREKPTLDDPRLELIATCWDGEGQLDYFAAREWKHGQTGMCNSSDVRSTSSGPGEEWWRLFQARGQRYDFDPFHGGYNPLHLGHSDPVGQGAPEGQYQGSFDVMTRRAVLVVDGFWSWKRELEEFGATLPSVGDRSWHVEVFDRKIGFPGPTPAEQGHGGLVSGKAQPPHER